jgi:CubicO group peptidase (beta-lactamase class C family)
MEQAVERRFFSCGCLLVAQQGHPLLYRAYGQSRLDTMYDLASLTKVFATTAVLMQLVARGTLDLNTPIALWLPEMDRRGMRRLKLWHLLAHASGLPAWLPLYQQVQNVNHRGRRQALRLLVANTSLEDRPGAAVVYSDLGFILLDWMIERVTGQRLDRIAHREIYQPLNLRRTRFIDLLGPASHREALRQKWHFAPTERCSWRARRLQAEVHDENCHAMGGISGHAGLFSTAYELHLLARELLEAYHGHSLIFDRRTVRRFFDHRPLREATRVMGWDTPSAQNSSSGHLLSPHSVGHLGFTGTSIWLDLPRHVAIILLTNRVYYGRHPNPLRAFRPRLHDAIMRGLT